jgi:hypothetical protein
VNFDPKGHIAVFQNRPENYKSSSPTTTHQPTFFLQTSGRSSANPMLTSAKRRNLFFLLNFYISQKKHLRGIYLDIHCTIIRPDFKNFCIKRRHKMTYCVFAETTTPGIKSKGFDTK